MRSLDSLADRVWFALHCLPRDAKGRPPASTVLEASQGLARGLIGKLTGERQRELRGPTLMRLAQALQVSTEWLLEGRGPIPVPTGPVPARPGTSLPPREADADDLPARAAAIAFAQACGVDARVLEAARALPKHAYSPEEWLAVLKTMAAELRVTGKISRGAPSEARDARVPKQRSKK